MQVLASQLPFLAIRNAELAVPPLFWPDNCIKIGGHVALLSGPTVYTVAKGSIQRGPERNGLETLPRAPTTSLKTKVKYDLIRFNLEPCNLRYDTII